MKLRQLQYVTEVVKNGMNVTAAAEKLFTSQPGVSSQIKRLEEELGVTIFERSGKHINGLTPEGVLLVERFTVILNEVDNVKRIADDFSHPDSGMLSIATTHTQARYVLPPVINEFRKRYPKVQLQINQGTPEQIASLTDTGKADIGIATEALELFDNLILLPCYRWNRCLIVPKGHPLVKQGLLTLEAIAEHPIITYTFGVADRSVINRAFTQRGLSMNVVLMAADAEVIKTYVRNGLGVGICARMAYDRKQDHDLAVLDAGNLFDSSVTSLAIRKNAVLREYVYEFIQLFASHLNKGVVDQALKAHNDNTLQEKLYREHVKEAEMR
ncbi:HTH-type transcriptional regulator CysB [Arenicella xantha]|uniref:LysR family cys regulon transcriptional activator n=1 Tax=Arenicella xantha TaxID=644221 RepID=A0A395JHK4_9GAMM|nr:HTH-type transcriptional regulator CysB [Arenicella xantha]RBP48339.1 LysR family cys regulon transcriptional activator [Arenicella xantha]